MCIPMKCSLMGWRILTTVVIIIQLLLPHITIGATAAGTASPGDTTPSIIEVEIGGSFSITCNILKDIGANSSSLIFVEDNFNRIIPKEQLKIINSQTVQLTVHNATAQKGIYQCKSVDRPDRSDSVYLGETKVYVGTAPAEVSDFKCIINNYRNVNCSFTTPPNNIMINYELFLSDETTTKKSCGLLKGNYTVQYCTFDASSHSYRPISKNLTFNLIGRNDLGTKSEVYNFKSAQIVIPFKLEINKDIITSNSITLSWTVKDLYFFPTKTLKYEIKLQPKGFHWYTVTDSDYEVGYNGTTCNVIIKNLPYPNRDYKMEIRARSNYVGSEWNEKYVDSFHTKSRRPDSPPKTAVGCFYDDPSDQMRLYWQPLEEYEHNGPDFHYIISDANGEVVNTTTDFSIVLAERPQVDSLYSIRAKNSAGVTIDSSIIRVFSNNALRSSYPSKVVTVHRNHTYTLSWIPPRNRAELMNYTVFWCLSEIEQKSVCRGRIHFKYIDKTQTNFITSPLNSKLNMAVSANYLQYSTGMIWAVCYADIFDNLMQLKPEANAINATAINVKWSTDGVCISIIKGFNITYCEVVAGNGATTATVAAATNCLTKQMPREYDNYTISGLKPYSKYRISIIMYSEKRKSPLSEAVDIKTKESAPSKPRNLKLTAVTSNSAFLTWDPPLILNGVLKYYSIWLVKGPKSDDKEPFKEERERTPYLNYTLGSLSSYTNYTVHITAHTIENSEPSESKQFQTLIARPSSPYNVTMREEHGDYAILEWLNPDVPSGRVELYEVALKLQLVNGVTQERRIQVNGGLSNAVHKCEFRKRVCTKSLDRYYLSVRAINIARINEVDPIDLSALQQSNDDNASLVNSEESEINDFNCTSVWGGDSGDIVLKSFHNYQVVQLISEWKDANERRICTAANGKSVNILIAVVLAIFFAAILSFISVFIRKKYINMNDIDPVLPRGLIAINPTCGSFGEGSDCCYDNTTEKECAEISRSTEWIYNNHNHKESNHLLGSAYNSALNTLIPIDNTSNSSISNDSNGSDNCNVNNDTEKHQQQLLSLDQTSSNDEQSQSTDSVELNDVSNSSLYPSPMKLKTSDYHKAKLITRPTLALITGGCGGGAAAAVSAGGAYVTPSTMLFAAANHPAVIADNTSIRTFHPTPNGYVRPNTVMMLSSPLREHHQQQQQQQSNTGGYITCDTITGGKPSSILISNNISIPPSITTTCAVEHSANVSTNKLTSPPALGTNDDNASMVNPDIHGNNEIGSNNNNNSSICGYVTQRQLAEFGQMLH